MIRNSPHRGTLPRTEIFFSVCRMNLSPRPQRPRSLAVAVASLVVVVASGLVLAAGTAAPASAATPCWKTLINDWFDGKIDHTYPRECYTEAIQHLPRDIHTYSNADDEIRAAMLAAFQHKGKGTPPSGLTSQQAPGSNDEVTPSTSEPSATTAAPKSEEAKRGLILKAIEWPGPSDASAVPLPLLILAAVAFLLLAAAGGSLVNRRLQQPRLPPPPQG